MTAPTRLLGQPTLRERDAFRNLIEALRVAETSARQLAYVRQQPQWFLVQNGIEAVRDTVTKLAQRPLVRLEHKWLA